MYQVQGGNTAFHALVPSTELRGLGHSVTSSSQHPRGRHKSQCPSVQMID